MPGSVQSMSSDEYDRGIAGAAAGLFLYAVSKNTVKVARERDARNEQRANALFAAFDACKKFETGTYSRSWDKCLRDHGAQPDDVKAAQAYLGKRDYCDSVFRLRYKSVDVAHKYFFDSIFG